MARAALKWGVRDLGDAAGVSPATVTRIESGKSVNAATLTALRVALEDKGVEFIPGGVRLRALLAAAGVDADAKSEGETT